MASESTPADRERLERGYRCQRCGFEMWGYGLGGPRFCPQCGYTVYTPISRVAALDAARAEPSPNEHGRRVERLLDLILNKMQVATDRNREFADGGVGDEEGGVWAEIEAQAQAIVDARIDVEPSPEGEPSEYAELREAVRIAYGTEAEMLFVARLRHGFTTEDFVALRGTSRANAGNHLGRLHRLGLLKRWRDDPPSGGIEYRYALNFAGRAAIDRPARSTERVEVGELAAHVQALHDEEDRLAFLDDAAGAVMRSWARTHQRHAEEPYIGCVFCRDRFMPVEEHEAALVEAREEVERLRKRLRGHANESEMHANTLDRRGCPEVAAALLEGAAELRALLPSPPEEDE